MRGEYGGTVGHISRDPDEACVSAYPPDEYPNGPPTRGCFSCPLGACVYDASDAIREAVDRLRAGRLDRDRYMAERADRFRQLASFRRRRLPTKEIARRLGVSDRTVYRMCMVADAEPGAVLEYA